jgi:hypothetical protein
MPSDRDVGKPSSEEHQQEFRDSYLQMPEILE